MVVNFIISSSGSNIESRRRIRRYTDIIVFVFCTDLRLLSRFLICDLMLEK